MRASYCLSGRAVWISHIQLLRNLLIAVLHIPSWKKNGTLSKLELLWEREQKSELPNPLLSLTSTPSFRGCLLGNL